jgi:ABC-type polysaccharide/polyol phosphate export permease
MLTEQREYGDLLWQISRRDVLLRYKQSVMGLGWAVLMPLASTVIFSVIFTRVVRLDVGIPYPLFAYCGLAAWNFSASALRFAVTSLTANTSLVTKVYFPREVFPFSAVLVALVDFAVSLLVLVAMMAYYGVWPGWTIVCFPLVVAVHVTFTVGVALLLAMGNLFFRDVKYVFEVVIQVWMFATSVVYPVASIGGQAGAILAWNPMTPIIDAYRQVLLLGGLPDVGPFAAAALASVVLLSVSWVAFHRAEFKFAEFV